jgi:hypothetical protein
MQHSDIFNHGIERNFTTTKVNTVGKKTRKLPEFYSQVPPLKLNLEHPPISAIDAQLLENRDAITSELQIEHNWLETVRLHLGKENILEIKSLSWSASHASQCTDESSGCTIPTITSMLPLFPDSSTSPAMIRHS